MSKTMERQRDVVLLLLVLALALPSTLAFARSFAPINLADSCGTGHEEFLDVNNLGFCWFNGIQCQGNAFTGLTSVSSISYQVHRDFKDVPPAATPDARVYDLTNMTLVAMGEVDPSTLPGLMETSWVVGDFTMGDVLDKDHVYWIPMCQMTPTVSSYHMNANSDVGGGCFSNSDGLPSLVTERFFRLVYEIEYGCATPPPAPPKKRHLCKCRPQLGQN